MSSPPLDMNTPAEARHDNGNEETSIVKDEYGTFYIASSPVGVADELSRVSELHAFLRREVFELFAASEGEVELYSHCKLGQVGIRCKHCKGKKKETTMLSFCKAWSHFKH
jgi:hypothetical protein